MGLMQFHVPCYLWAALVTVFGSASVSCFYVYLVLDAAYCTMKILTLSHWVHLVMYTSTSNRASIVMKLHSTRTPLFLSIGSLDKFMYSTSHWGHHYVIPVVYMYWSTPIIWALILICILRHWCEHGYAIVHIYVWDYMYLTHFEKQ